MEADDLERVLTVGRAARVGDRAADDEQRRVVVGEQAALDVVPDPQQAVDRGRHARRDRRDRPRVPCEGGRLARGVVGREERDPLAPALDAVEELVAPRLAGRHLGEVLDVHGREDGLARAVSLAVAGLDAHAAPVLEHETGHLLPGLDRAAVILDQARERKRQGRRAAARERPAVLLAAVRERVRQRPGARTVGRLHGHEGHPEHERLRVRVLELRANDVPGAHGDATPPRRAEHLVGPRRPTVRVVPVRAEGALRLVVVGDQPPVGVGVAAREPGELVARLVEVAPLGQGLAVAERHVDDGIRVEVLEAVVLGQAKLLDRRARLDEVVRGRARVVVEAGERELLGGGVAADHRPRLEDEHLEARLGEIGGRDEAVVARPGDDDVDRAHETSVV